MGDIAVESGVVTRLQGDKALVRLERTESCQKCAAKLFCRPGSKGTNEMLAYNRLDARIGDRVKISETGNLLLKISLMQFGVPLLGLLMGILALNGFDFSGLPLPKELVLSLGGLIGILLGGGITWIWSKYMSKTISCVFEIASIQMKA